MPLSLHEISVGVMLPKLRMLSTLLDKAAAHAEAAGVDPATLVEARLASDMYPLSGQIQRVSDAAKFGAARLAGLTPPPFEDNETTLDQLKDRLARTIAYLESVGPDQVDGREEETVILPLRDRKVEFTGRSYALTMVLPNFYFHVVTAYDILRHKGVEIGKRDYLALAG
ncbi:DUF1993 domain-containing protein [Inquilinus limosus]|uniref:DUF1993 domain-containing protein n=1 Tax=Inquilinus limosus MP06 TaxID=1398085 RepID=A0A0A0DCU5_9PROT|nr:DUF1993 domain-containing protein [Inquilinus limosus]KGM35825.1 hypothetical protein P409_02245 [Inquilinus limosus MP06]